MGGLRESGGVPVDLLWTLCGLVDIQQAAVKIRDNNSDRRGEGEDGNCACGVVHPLREPQRSLTNMEDYVFHALVGVIDIIPLCTVVSKCAKERGGESSCTTGKD